MDEESSSTTSVQTGVAPHSGRLQLEKALPVVASGCAVKVTVVPRSKRHSHARCATFLVQVVTGSLSLPRPGGFAETVPSPRGAT